MRRMLVIVAMLATASASGCTWYDAAFNVFGDHYSGGGNSIYEKRADYNESARAYGADQW